jgi:amidase
MHFETVESLVAKLQAKTISSVELVEMMIARIDAIDPKLNAIVVRDVDRAREAAKAADAARAKGDDRPLLGVPMTVKEAIDVAGLPTTWGLPGTQHTNADRDALVVERLKAAGAIIIGKTNVAMMLSDWQSANPVYGRTNNPWDVTRTAGGSSGGAAVALAAGMTFLECGSDFAGSLRIPASFCGILTHRPTHGLVPMHGFAPPGAPRDEHQPPVDQAVLGPMARSASDLMRALDILAGPDEADGVAWELRLPPPRADTIDRFRVLIVDEHPLIPTANAIRTSLDTLASTLERAGCKVGRDSHAHRDRALPDIKELSTLFTELLMAFFSADMPAKEFEATRDKAITHRDWILADRRRRTFAGQWAELFKEWDVVLCPAAPTVAFPHDERPFDRRTIDIDGKSMPYQQLPLWTAWPTPTGQPVTAMPIARDESGLPIGIQIIGPRLEDRTPIAFARAVEGLIGGFAPVDFLRS